MSLKLYNAVQMDEKAARTDFNLLKTYAVSIEYTLAGVSPLN